MPSSTATTTRRRRPRADPAERLGDLIATATRVFITQGYRRTQMADVAQAMGVAKGTIYLYVESKEALFDLVVRQAAGNLDVASVTLPVRAPRPGATLRRVKQRLFDADVLPSLSAALARRGRVDVRRELRGIVQELHTVLATNRIGIKLVDRCATDYPELARLWFEEGRVRQLDRLTQYLETPNRRRQLRAFPDAAIAARIAIETITLWAVHRHWDPAPQPMDDTIAEQTVIDFVLEALVRE